jgi:hypothetical protein
LDVDTIELKETFVVSICYLSADASGDDAYRRSYDGVAILVVDMA